MTISMSMVGTDFKINNSSRLSDDGKNVIECITDQDPLFKAHKGTFDYRTGYLCTEFTPAKNGGVTNDLGWYVDYMTVNHIVLASFMQNHAGRDNAALNMLNIGYIPVGYQPSFVAELNPFMVSLLELRKVPYVFYRATTMGNLYFRSETKDIWVHKLDAAEYLGCSPSDVTFTRLLGGLIHGR